MNYAPLFDIVITTGELVLLAALAVHYIFDSIFQRRFDELFRRGGMWGGE